jgi:hypothetical protein
MEAGAFAYDAGKSWSFRLRREAKAGAFAYDGLDNLIFSF